MFTIDPTVLQLIIATFIPLAVGLVTKKVASSGIKAVLLAFLSAVTAIVVAASESAGVVTSSVVVEAFQNFVVAVAMYYGVWKPTNTTGTIQDKTSEFGISGRS